MQSTQLFVVLQQQQSWVRIGCSDFSNISLMEINFTFYIIGGIAPYDFT